MQLRGALRPIKCATCSRKLWFFHRKVKNNDGSVLCWDCSETWRENKIQTKQHFKEEPILEKKTINETEEMDIEPEHSIVKEYDVRVVYEKDREIARFTHDVDRQKEADLIRRKH